MLLPPSDDDELRSAIAEAEEAEARLLQMKASLMPRNRADALRDLVDAELRAMIEREAVRFRAAIIATRTEDEARAVLEEMSQAMAAATERIKTEMLSQMRAWTIAGIEERTKADKYT